MFNFAIDAQGDFWFFSGPKRYSVLYFLSEELHYQNVSGVSFIAITNNLDSTILRDYE